MKKLFKNTKGFTLIELILVVAILTIISTITISAINPLAQFQKANDVKVKSDLAQVQRALESYYNDNGTYPPSTPDYKITNTITNASMDWGGSWSPYMNFLPVPPGTSKYIYFSSQNRQAYFLYANVELGNEPKSCGGACTGAQNYAGSPNTVSACGNPAGQCNYGVTSPNVSP